VCVHVPTGAETGTSVDYGICLPAQMGMMPAVILFLNCLGAVFPVAVMVLLFKAKFLTKS